MRRSNRHHASTAAADALILPKSPSRGRGGGDGKSGARSVASNREPKSSIVVEPRKQRAAAVAAKDAMTLIANNGLATKDDPKSANSGKKDGSSRLGKRGAATAASLHASKISRASTLEEIPISAKSNLDDEKRDAKSDYNDNTSDSLNTVLDVSATIPHDLSHFPRELTVKEVIAKTMRVNRVSTRGLSRDIVGLMKDMRNEEKQSLQAASSESSTVTSVSDIASVEASKNSLDVVIDGVLSMARKPSAMSLNHSQLAPNTALQTENSPPKPKRQYVRVRATSNGELYVNGQLYAPNSVMNDATTPPGLAVDKTLPSTPVSSSQSLADSPVDSVSQPIVSSPQPSAPTKTPERYDLKRNYPDSQTDHNKDHSDPHLDEEIAVDVDNSAVSSSKLIPRELSVSEKVLIINDFDEGLLPHELEQKYNITKLQVAEVLRNRIPIIRQQATSLSDRHALKRRRTNFVGLNLLMWRFFCECRDQGIVLNGRQLKEHALSIARQLGLHNFKGSEGWLDSFKRRHNIDLKTMTGQPVIYEAEADLNGFCHNENVASTADGSMRMNGEDSALPIVDANQFLIDVADAAAKSASIQSGNGSNMNSVSSPYGGSATDAGPCQATAAVHTTQPLDLARMFPSTSSSYPLSNSLVQASADYVFANGVNLSNQRLDSLGPDTLQALVETCLYRADEPEVSRAVETLRSYITMTDISLLPLLVSLQKGLTGIAARKKQKALDQDPSNQASDLINDQTSMEQKDFEAFGVAVSVDNGLDMGVNNLNCHGSNVLNNVVTSTTSNKACHEPGLAGMLPNVMPQIPIDSISSHSSQC